MYLRIRKIDKNNLITGEHTLMIATTQSRVGAIEMNPGVLEWWDGIEWKRVEIVDEKDTKDPV